MSSLVSAALTVRKTARSFYGMGTSLVLGVACVLGVFSRPVAELTPWHGVLMVAWLAVFGLRTSARFREEERGKPTARTDLELGLLLLVAVQCAVQVGGGVTGELYPLVYVLVAFLASFARKAAGSILVLVAVAFEAGLYFFTEGRTDPKPFAFHTVFVVFFGILNLVFTRAEIARVREHSRRERDEERERVREESRLFRLVSVPTQSSAKDDERLFRSSLEEVHNALFHHLEFLQRSLDLHTCVLLFLDDTRTELRIAELVTTSEDVGTGPFALGAGAVGAVISRGAIMNLEHIKPGYRGLCYYEGPSDVRAFLGVPIMDDDKVVGALCVDRREDRPFTPRDEETLKLASLQVMRITKNERVFVQLEQSKHEQQILYRASQSLGAAHTEDQVLDACMEAARDVAAFDFAAVTYYDPKKRSHAIRRAEGEGAEALQKFTFSDNTSLTAMAVKNLHYLPYRGEFDPRQQVIFTKRANLPGMSSALVVPLIVGEKAIGTLALAAKRDGAFGASVRPTVQVLANQVAVSLSNALAVRRLEEMATTDGLTGCLNKRAFLDELESKMKSAERFSRELSLVVTDIDHFKKVNDTYGHATGDVVIKALGEILRRVKRETDVVARFGGEEFCVLCEETGAEGAVMLAERIREELEKAEFPTESGLVKVTCSLGVATFPTDAGSGAELFETADKALYAAKNSGRNRVCVL